jgi:hypothetical protein
VSVPAQPTALAMTSDQVSTSIDAVLDLLLLVVLLLPLVFALCHFILPICLSHPGRGNRTRISPTQYCYFARVVIEGHQVAPDLLSFLVVYGVCAAHGRVDELGECLRVGGWRGEAGRTFGAANSLREVGLAAIWRCNGALLEVIGRCGLLVGDGRRQRSVFETAGRARRQT